MLYDLCQKRDRTCALALGLPVVVTWMNGEPRYHHGRLMRGHIVSADRFIIAGWRNGGRMPIGWEPEHGSPMIEVQSHGDSEGLFQWKTKVAVDCCYPDPSHVLGALWLKALAESADPYAGDW